MGRWQDRNAYGISHVGWGLHERGLWHALSLYGSTAMGLDGRVFEGNFLFSTGPNHAAGRESRCHFDIPMRHCGLFLDGTPILIDRCHRGALDPARRSAAIAKYLGGSDYETLSKLSATMPANARIDDFTARYPLNCQRKRMMVPHSLDPWDDRKSWCRSFYPRVCAHFVATPS
jgi:hypothetical protein